MAIKSSLLTTSNQAISPSSAEVSNKDIAVTVMFFCNLNTPDPMDDTIGREFIDIFVVQDGDTPTDTNKIINNLPVDAGDTFTFSAERLVLNAGDRVFASASNASVISTTISYVVI